MIAQMVPGLIGGSLGCMRWWYGVMGSGSSMFVCYFGRHEGVLVFRSGK